MSTKLALTFNLDTNHVGGTYVCISELWDIGRSDYVNTWCSTARNACGILPNTYNLIRSLIVFFLHK